jgi:hypothetical protein
MITPTDPAFPAELSSSGPQHGMDLRTYIATRVMATLYTTDNIIDHALAAAHAVQAADALIAELNKSRP